MRIFEVYFAFFLCMLGIVLVTSDDNYDDFYNNLLIYHNVLRREHDAKALILDQELSDIAKERAEKLLKLKINIPRDDDVYGMNFFGRIVLNDNIPNAFEVFRFWYHEIENHDYDDEPVSDNTGLGAVLVQLDFNEPRIIEYASKTLGDIERKYPQIEKEAFALVWGVEKINLYRLASFTQIVWQSTSKVGFAMVRDPYYVMVIAIYKPPGNIEGQFANNVSKYKE